MILDISDDHRVHWTIRSVSALLAQGMSRKQVAETMAIEIKTVHRAVKALRTGFNASRETSETLTDSSHTVSPPKDNMSQDSKDSKDGQLLTEKGENVFKLIIACLNKESGKDFRWKTKPYQEHIRARWSEGYDLQAFYDVIWFKCSEWKGTEWEQFLQPNTLFIPKHFDGYLQQARGALEEQQNAGHKSDEAIQSNPVF